MYAVYTEVTIPDGAPTDGAAAALWGNAVPAVRQAGARNAYWMAPTDGRLLGVVVFDDEAAARSAAAGIPVGERAANAPAGVTYRTVDVREVIAHL
jgi:hypothetical protein